MEKRDWLLPGGFGKHSKDQKKENSGSTCAMWNKLLTKEQAPCHWRLGRENLSTGRTLESSNPASHPKLGSPLPGSSQMASGLRPLPGGHQRELQTSAGKTWSLKSPYRPLHSPEDKQTKAASEHPKHPPGLAETSRELFLLLQRGPLTCLLSLRRGRGRETCRDKEEAMSPASGEQR